MNLFDDIKTGLGQTIEFEKGNLKAKATTLIVEPVEHFESEEIKSIRKETGLTQVLFAKYMGVSVKTVETWESGRNHPEGAACRLLSMTRNDPSFSRRSGIVTASVKKYIKREEHRLQYSDAFSVLFMGQKVW